MNCPRKKPWVRNSELPKEFSKWNKVCQECSNFEDCIDGMVDIEGENYPGYTDIHAKLNALRERQQFVEKLNQEGVEPITNDDIIDMLIEIERYNKQCSHSL